MSNQLQNDWFLDSGCSAHLTVDKSNFISEETSSKLTITTANDQQMETNCVGDIQLPVRVSDQSFDVNVENVLYVPDLKVNLLSESRTFFFPELDHESDSRPPIEDFSDEESDDSSGEEPPNFEEDKFEEERRIRRPPQTHNDYVNYSSFVENFNNPTSVEEVLASPDKENWLKMRTVPYQEAVGSLLFAGQVSRPDVNFAISYVSRFNQNPGKVHWTAVKRIMCYLKGTAHWKLEFSGRTTNITEITGFSDSDWASDEDERRSVTGYIFLKNNSPIWATKLNHIAFNY
ncbi:hypothetical protein JTB14_029319 [Gonioctena quinquepunctata]|nr:hypothetical protein JTB14_029319 [Gonioctena quinquepunctata]